MHQLNTYLAHHEIDRRLRDVEHHRRIRPGRVVRGAERAQMAACIGR
jgi:hypothetical protein